MEGDVRFSDNEGIKIQKIAKDRVWFERSEGTRYLRKKQLYVSEDSISWKTINDPDAGSSNNANVLAVGTIKVPK